MRHPSLLYNTQPLCLKRMYYYGQPAVSHVGNLSTPVNIGVSVSVELASPAEAQMLWNKFVKYLSN